MAFPTFEEFKSGIPSAGKIAIDAIERVVREKGFKKEDVKAEFSWYVKRIEDTCYEIYKEKEAKSWDAVVGNRPHNLVGQFADVYDFFNSVAQSRKARAGSTFEEIIRTLFRRLEYPFEEQKVIDGKPDFILPSVEYYVRNAPDTIIFTAKRTLRERWRQIATEGNKTLGLFLATIDGDVKTNDLNEMKTLKIFLVVPKDLKTGRQAYATAENVMSYEDFFEDYLDPAMVRWRRKKVIL